jgi:hypothetical protein
MPKKKKDEDAKEDLKTRLQGTGTKTRKVHPPYDAVWKAVLDVLVIPHWRQEAPATTDAPRVGHDDVAENIVPGNDRNCAAVFIRPGANLPLVAMNSWNTHLVEGGGQPPHAQIYAANGYEKVQYTDAQLHSEMKILEYSFPKGPYYIGISKPGCLRCQVVMNIQGITSRGCSGGLWNAGWHCRISFVTAPPR